MASRIFFTREMAEAIKAGHKIATTRDHPIDTGVPLDSCTGSWRRPSSIAKFGIVTIVFRAMLEGPYRLNYSLSRFREEGFQSREMMESFLKNRMPQYLVRDPLWYHRFRFEGLDGRVIEELQW